MHVTVDLNWFLQFIVTALLVVFGLLYLVKNTASKYFVVDANFDSDGGHRSDVTASMPGDIGTRDDCVVCGNLTNKQCAGCKIVRYCSEACQRSHWHSGHKAKCKDAQSSGKVNLQGRRSCDGVPLVPASGTKCQNFSKKILFPYNKFVELFNWEKPGFPPCGLLNCGNSCFANVVLQCLTYTRPLVAYLVDKGHRRECRRNDWCFFCELQSHVERASQSIHAFSPINILSRLPNIGGNLGYGKQEDAHEFMRFAIDTMQSACLDEFGGEKAVHPSSQETTLIQHIFGGHLQSQVICTKCNNVSNQFENMMDLTVEIQGDAASLEECLEQFTAKEWLHGDNMYKCDGCNDYVLAWKRLTIRQAPNILTIALKRFQGGRFGKLNKRVTFPETLDLSPYMSEAGDGNDVYKLYAVVVHVDMLNASFFGHYICYTEDFSGSWYRIDDCKVTRVELDEVLSQGAYMLLYSRVCARKSCLNPMEEPSRKEEQETSKVSKECLPCAKQPSKCFPSAESVSGKSGSLLFDSSSQAKVSSFEEFSSPAIDVREDLELVDFDASFSVSKDIEVHGDGCSNATEGTTSPFEHGLRMLSDDTSLNDPYFTEASVLKHELPLPVLDVENVNVADECGATDSALITSLIEGSVSIQNYVGEKGETGCDESFCISSMGEEDDEMVFVNTRAKLEMTGTENGMPPPSSILIKDAVEKSDGTNYPGPKLKPIFPPGFLGKRPRNKYTKRCACNLIDQDNLFFNPGLSHQTGREIMGEEKPRFDEYNGSTSSEKGKQVGKSKNEGDMVTIESLYLSNGDSGVASIHSSVDDY